MQAQHPPAVYVYSTPGGGLPAAGFASPQPPGPAAPAAAVDSEAGLQWGAAGPPGSGLAWHAQLGYEQLLSTQQDQHHLALQHKDAEAAHLRAWVQALRASRPLEELQVTQLLQTKEEETAAMMAAKHKELELMAGLLKLREQQIEYLGALVDSSRLDTLGQDASALTQPGAAQLPLQPVPQPPDHAAADHAVLLSGTGLPQPAFQDGASEAAQLRREMRRMRMRLEDLESYVVLDGEAAQARAGALSGAGAGWDAAGGAGRRARLPAAEVLARPGQEPSPLHAAGPAAPAPAAAEEQMTTGQPLEEPPALLWPARPQEEAGSLRSLLTLPRGYSWGRRYVIPGSGEAQAPRCPPAGDAAGFAGEPHAIGASAAAAGRRQADPHGGPPGPGGAGAEEQRAEWAWDPAEGPKPSGVSALSTSAASGPPSGSAAARSGLDAAAECAAPSPARAAPPHELRAATFLDERGRPDRAGWRYPAHAGDPLDAAIAALVNQPGRYSGWRAMLCRLGRGLYLCGTRRMRLQVDSSWEQIRASSDDGRTWADLNDMMNDAEGSQRALLERARSAVRFG